MMGVKITFNALDAFAAQTETDVQAVVDQTAQAVAEMAKANAPVRTGRLKNSIRATGGTVEATAPYAAIVEERKPFLAPAVETATPYFIEAVGEAVDTAARKVGK